MHILEGDLCYSFVCGIDRLVRRCSLSVNTENASAACNELSVIGKLCAGLENNMSALFYAGDLISLLVA